VISIKYLYLILLPLLILAQSTKKILPISSEEEYDWSVSDKNGMVLRVSGDSIDYEEKWMHIPAQGVSITSKTNEPIQLENLRPPFEVIVSFYGKNGRVYIKSLQFLRQFAYDAEGMIINSQ